MVDYIKIIKRLYLKKDKNITEMNLILLIFFQKFGKFSVVHTTDR